MIQSEDVLDFMLDNARKLLFPKEWINLDLSMSKTEVICLLWMTRHEEVIMRDIALFLNIPLSTATGVVNRLVKNGYVDRFRSDTDRRVVVIRLTEKGQHVVEDVKATVSHYLRLVTEILTTEEATQLLHIVQKVVTHLDRKPTDDKNHDTTSKMQNIPIE